MHYHPRENYRMNEHLLYWRLPWKILSWSANFTPWSKHSGVHCFLCAHPFAQQRRAASWWKCLTTQLQNSPIVFHPGDTFFFLSSFLWNKKRRNETLGNCGNFLSLSSSFFSPFQVCFCSLPPLVRGRPSPERVSYIAKGGREKEASEKKAMTTFGETKKEEKRKEKFWHNSTEKRDGRSAEEELRLWHSSLSVFCVVGKEEKNAKWRVDATVQKGITRRKRAY